MNNLFIQDKTTAEMAVEYLNSFDEVVSYYQPKLQKFIFYIVGEKELACDLTQDTFLAAFRFLQNRTKSPSLKAEASPNFNLPSWLYTIAHNKAIDALRRRHRSYHAGLTPHFDDEFVTPATEPVTNIETSIISREELTQAIKKVGRQKLDYFLMHENGFSYQEIAEMNGTSLSMVKGKIFRAKKSLREALNDKSRFIPAV